MKNITLPLNHGEVAAIAEWLLAEETGESCPAHCAAIARDTLNRFVGQAVVGGGVQDAASMRVLEVDRARYVLTRTMPASRRAGMGGRA